MVYFSHMDFFKKKEPTIVADMAADVAPASQAQPGGTTSFIASSGTLSQMVERSLELSEENNTILRRMQAWDRIALWVKLFFWALVLGLPVLFFQPIVEYVKASVMENPSAFGIPSQEEFQKALSGFGGRSDSK